MESGGSLFNPLVSSCLRGESFFNPLSLCAFVVNHSLTCDSSTSKQGLFGGLRVVTFAATTGCAGLCETFHTVKYFTRNPRRDMRGCPFVQVRIAVSSLSENALTTLSTMKRRTENRKKPTKREENRKKREKAANYPLPSLTFSRLNPSGASAKAVLPLKKGPEGG
jgi:hypothetical protein